LASKLRDRAANFLSPIGAFLVPEPNLSAKLIFDNVRNYLVVGAFFAVSNWLQSGGIAMENPFFNPKFGGQHSLIHSWVFWSAVALFSLNLLQSLELGRRGADAIVRIFERFLNNLTTHKSALVSVGLGFTALLSMLVFFLLSILATLLLILVFAAIVTHIGYARVA
jgi:hypothetical protein